MLEGAAGFAGFAVDGVGQGPHDPDLSCVPQADSTVFPLPWKPGLAWIAGNLQSDGQNWDYCPRTILSRALDDAKAKGFTLMTGVEPEFFLVDRKADGTLGIADAADTLSKPCYGQLSLLRNADFLMTLVTQLNSLGYGVYQNDHEDANGQFEINWRFADALLTADRVSFFKFMVKALAEERGLHATFMPKPFPQSDGQRGAPPPVPLGRGRQRQPVPGQERPARPVLRRPLVPRRPARPRPRPVRPHRPLGQLLQAVRRPLAPERSDLGARLRRPRRQQPDHDGARPRAGAPGIPHGGRLLQPLPGRRRPAGGGHGRYHAGPEGGCRAATATCFCLSPKQAEEQGIALLPANLGEALDALEADDVLCGALGSDYAAAYLQAKREEWDE